MKYKGKVVSGSSLLTILGVVCFATVVVSAVLITSNTLSFAPTNVTTGAITLTDSGSDTTAVLAGNNAAYHFNANVADALTGAVITVEIAKTGIALSDVTNATIRYNGAVTPTALVFSLGTNVITATYTVGTQAISATLPCTISVTYATAGSYTVSATMSGTA
ncbi:MAG: hypothetical protein ABR879_06415 [Methanomassiliicoccales archaeon]|jgi:hypothetical protein